MRRAVKEQGKLVEELVSRIGRIKSKAEISENQVKTICSDIKNLDNAKKNLTWTISALKKQMMLITAIDQLRDACINKCYKEAARLIEATGDLLKTFDEYKSIPQIQQIKKERDHLCHQLRIQISEELSLYLFWCYEVFRITYEKGLNTTFFEAFLAMTALGPQAIDECKDWFCKFILQPYVRIYVPTEEIGGLENTDKRFMWLKKTLREFKERFEPYFPSDWLLPICICLEFCRITKYIFFKEKQPVSLGNISKFCWRITSVEWTQLPS
eukprot:TRINITY_DN107236_c0_g1_i1.p1 TRINITY_DN107236_c0_g1~~TRINITY_DN107236_c0_g1_i1.p1  ORF type:complete len:270 (+),score=26.47 TRINITY_DN107236_c0_g1_i1:377-1186(+)